MFFSRQVLVKAAPGAKTVPSGTVTSVTNCTLSQEEGGTVDVGVGAVLVGVAVGGVPVTVGVTVTGVAPTRAMIGFPHKARSPVTEP